MATHSSILAWRIPLDRGAWWPTACLSSCSRGDRSLLELCVVPAGDGDLSLPLGLAPGSPIFPSGCEGKLGVALESLQGRRDLT